MTRPDDLHDVRLGDFRADLAGPAPEVRTLARAQLQRAIDAPPAEPASRRVWGRRAGAVLAAAAVVTVVALVAPWSTGPGQPDTAAAAALDRAADSAGRSTAAPAVPGAYVHVLIRARWASTDVSSGVTYLQDQVAQTWTPDDGIGTAVHRVTYGKPTYLRPGDENRLSAGSQPPPAGSTSTFGYSAVDGSFADPSEAFTAGLPSDVSQLYARVRAAAGGDTGAAGQRMLTDVGNVLGFSVATPAVRRALYEVLTRIPGVRLVPDTTDYAGRRGTTVAITTGGTEEDLIFDPATGLLLGEREVARSAQPGIPAGTVTGWSSFQTSLVAKAPTP